MLHILNRFDILNRFVLALDCKPLFDFFFFKCGAYQLLFKETQDVLPTQCGYQVPAESKRLCVFESGPQGIAQDFQSLICTPERVRCGWAGSRGSPGSVAVQTPSLLEVRVKIMCLFSVTGNRHSMMANKCFETKEHKGELICIKWLHYTVF